MWSVTTPTTTQGEYVGMTLKESNFTNRFKAIILTTIKSTEALENGKMKVVREAKGIAQSGMVLAKDDIPVLLGELKDINRLIQKGE